MKKKVRMLSRRFHRSACSLAPGHLSSSYVVLLLGIILSTCDARISKNGKVVLDRVEQQKLVFAARRDCITKKYTEAFPLDGKVYCNTTWDDIMCWPYTLGNTTREQECPSYVNGFDVRQHATRECGADGKWRFYPELNKTWTNYSACMQVSAEGDAPEESGIIEDHLPRIKVMYQVGFSLSVVSLTIAIFIMIYFKKLHCARNTIHINLFLSFILRAVVLIIKDSTFVNGMGFSYDVLEDDVTGRVIFNPNTTHWQCKLLITFTWYSLCTNLMWIFVEALYLYLLIFVAVFSERNNIIRYIIFGWTAPLSFIVPWVLVRLYFENDYCWHLNTVMGYVWIIQGPIVLVVMANFFIFLATVWILFTKLRASNTPEARNYRYRKLARSTLVLIPLFGVYYILLVWLPVGAGFNNGTFEVVYHYIHAFLDSYQGIAVAFLFCFLNGEVRTELSKKCSCSHGELPPGKRSTWTTVSTYMSRARHSLHSTVMDKSEFTAQSNGGSFTKHSSIRNPSPPPSPPKDNTGFKDTQLVMLETKLLSKPLEEQQKLITTGKEESRV